MGSGLLQQPAGQGCKAFVHHPPPVRPLRPLFRPLSLTQRTVDTWTFFTVFRTQLYFLDRKWSYIGGFTEEKKKERTRVLARYMLESVLNLGGWVQKGGSCDS